MSQTRSDKRFWQGATIAFLGVFVFAITLFILFLEPSLKLGFPYLGVPLAFLFLGLVSSWLAVYYGSQYYWQDGLLFANDWVKF